MRSDMVYAHSLLSAASEVALVDVDTESPSVQSTLNSWISGFVTEYAIDGLRIDGQCMAFGLNVKIHLS